MLGKLENGQLKYATGKVIEHDGLITVNPTDEFFVSIGYKPIEHKHLKEKEGFYQVVDSYEEKSDKILVKYRYEEVTEEEEV